MPALLEPEAADHVILVDDDARPVGTCERSRVHHHNTPLHLAFSCYVLDDAGRLLVTRRALAKRTWPGVWTNSFCGHPRLGESAQESVERHAAHELELAISDLRLIVPGFRYRAVDTSGVVENEICPIYSARAITGIKPNLEEVMDHAWTRPDDLERSVAATPWAFSPWLVLQLKALCRGDAEPGALARALDGATSGDPS